MTTLTTAHRSTADKIKDALAPALSPATRMLVALQGSPIYQGTVPAHVKARRRARNKVARRSRQINRRNG